jgi:hypothetical protein
MDADRFAGLLRSASTLPSRRYALQLLVSALLGGLFAIDPTPAPLTTKGKGKKKKKKRKSCANSVHASVRRGGGGGGKTCGGGGSNTDPGDDFACEIDEDCLPGNWCSGHSCIPGCNSHTHCDDCHLCDFTIHQCCAFAGNLCGLTPTCP